MARKAAWIVSILLLLNTGVLGVYDGLTELADAHSALQKSVTIGVLLYGVLGLAAAATLIVRKRAAVWLAVAWSIVITYVASTAALAYSDEDASIGGAIAGGVGAALIGALVVWCGWVVTRPASLSERLQPPSSSTR